MAFHSLPGPVTSRSILMSPRIFCGDGDYTDLQTSASWAGRVATIENLSLGAFGGLLKARGNYDMRETTLRFAVTTTVKAMDLTQIFRSMLPSAAIVPLES
jgi:hypothetical protein